ncbi:SDR family oxidoreductase [Streptomyces chartreusis]|uniref:SDR family oxidoreductase n=1 Tax=Streptomyces chartreusis TaxID=1969 RepID=UPI002F90CB52
MEWDSSRARQQSSPAQATAHRPGAPCAEAVNATFRATVPLGRHETTEEVAAAVAFLASDQCSVILGTSLYVDNSKGQLLRPCAQ